MPKLGDGHVDVVTGELIDGVVVTALLESGADAEGFADGGGFLTLGDAAGLGDAVADESRSAAPTPGACTRGGLVKGLAHGERGGTDLADVAVPGDLLGREHVFEEEQVILLDALWRTRTALVGEMRSWTSVVIT